LSRKRVIILGSTGSIGANAVDVLTAMRDEWEIVGLAAGARAALLAQQARDLGVRAVALAAAERVPTLRQELNGSTDVFAGNDALLELVDSVDCDCVISAVVGTAGLAPTFRAVEQGRRVALANKEALVVAGGLLTGRARETGARIIPVDSEHSAIFQALQAGRGEDVHGIYLTASGGPFRTWTAEQMANASLADALNHPTWDMGPKVTIDSATMMNKALEIVEAHWLFDMPADRIQVVVHPESIVHSLVEFCDGSLVAQLGAPDMRMPIQYALTYPQRRPCPAPRLDLHTVGKLTLEPPDEQLFPALRLGREVAARGGTSGAVLNAANEAAVDLFRQSAIRFGEIADLVERALEGHAFVANPSLDELLEADRWAREEVSRCVACR
jgi:1-deoxy-D-xylulose-5-phosphate reductoisomerase